ncbi:arylsulfatase [Neolewinella aurantiaca]|uniref:Arylsulfatase n=1 Tax=Neolewinella aurantiaca TaxID=2602767 RepID=A0A5C7FJY6_9BACT|nr:arylsulfatase [Neolewinella aurantiaca]TXF90223.1 arylsulfatase [Neolewinella aurantiaca]
MSSFNIYSFSYRGLALVVAGFLLSGCAASIARPPDRPPNVIIVLTDDQGSGDLGCNGNPWLKTPNIDGFYERAVRMTDFHVSPLCTPSRAALMTGRYPINNGAWATFKGRDALSKGTTTLAEVFRDNGYRTGIFGKWHLGDNYPVRPTDCGFEVAVHHKAGGVGELSDHWGNSYFDDVYYVNNTPASFKGYCTDVWFEEATKFIAGNGDDPFFVYLSINAPHDPWIVADEYAAPYRHLEGSEILSANFYGMIANIDENFRKLEQFLEQSDLLDNTVLIFMTDNGTRGGISADGQLGYNHGLRGRKGAVSEGGHRVPFFIRWPGGRVEGGRDVGELTAHVDLMPSLAGLCGFRLPQGVKVDGVDFSPLLTGAKQELPDRNVFVHHRQDWRPPAAVNKAAILNEKWRLLNGDELYDVEEDRLQDRDVAAQHPDLVRRMRADNARFIAAAQAVIRYDELPCTVIGNEAQEEVKLTIQHAIGEDVGIWKADQVAAGMKNSNNTHAIEVEREGWYEIACRRWPKECPGPTWGIPAENPKNLYQYQPVKPERVRISIANQILEKDVKGNEEAVVFRVRLTTGKTLLVNDFIEGGEHYGVYYTYIRPLSGG